MMLYIHIPYCRGKCIYCDFYSGGNPDWKKYLKAVASEMSERIDNLRGDCLSSIYIGGGTPSLIPLEEFRDFFGKNQNNKDNFWNILGKSGIDICDDIEITIEVNPEDVTDRMAACWAEVGVNRVSMGVQSLNDAELNFLKRRHNAERVNDAFQILKRYFNNISIDIIYGIPGQNLEILASTIDKVLDFAPRHISAYALTYENNTPLGVLRNSGRIKEVSEDDYLELEGLVNERLKTAGYERYEISNFAKPGYESKHNRGYWTGKAYIGLGPSASSFDGKNLRRTNRPDIRNYINGNIQFDEEILTAEQRLSEILFTGLRTREGLELTILGEEIKKELLNKAEKWISKGKMKLFRDKLSLTEEGYTISDYIILDLI